MEQGQKSTIRQNIRIDVNQCCQDGKQVMANACEIEFRNFTVETKTDAIADTTSR